ncbi:MAG: threonine synthase [Leadbetterella sp.]|nr:threonine synthase [Leadbetterella sp.]
MKLYSTNHISPEVSFREAIFRGLPADHGLYMPTEIPTLPQSFWDNVENLSFNEIAVAVSEALLGEDIPETDLETLIHSALDFEAPAVKLAADLYCLELFHGPSMAFKDFGARFMAATMSYFLGQSGETLNILVATSGDTGGAVAQGFYRVPGISVTILYPKGKVSAIQERQLTTLGENVKALEVEGTFDDCQALVKQAFLDEELRNQYHLASANSINIARLIPQAFYYISAYAQLKKTGKELVFSVPSGNFGNLTAGILALRMGMPVKRFVAATNVNNVVPEFLRTGLYTPISPSISTISNAMDVGNPSNFPRLKALLGHQIHDYLTGYFYTDEETRRAVLDLYRKYNYLACPHTAVAYLGLQDYRRETGADLTGVFLSTAHYGKFLPEMEAILGFTPEIPDRLSMAGEKQATVTDTAYDTFRAYLKKNLI